VGVSYVYLLNIDLNPLPESERRLVIEKLEKQSIDYLKDEDK
jgi:hypothetical protein